MPAQLDRRRLLASAASTAFLLQAGGLSKAVRADEAPKSPQAGGPLAIATWNFGLKGTEKAYALMQSGSSPLDAVEQGIRVVESLGDGSVGLSGRPNAAGFVQLDACIMHGPGHLGGSVAGVEGVPHVITLARRVMENTRHVMLVGREARNFAIAEGLETRPIDDHEAKSSTFWKAYASEQAKPAAASEKQHDTVTLLALGADGTISGGCSTSGLAEKLPGRVGDSPILGSGLYVDNDVGAAGGTGIGENILRYCASFMIVDLMRQGMHPTKACQEAIRRIAAKEPVGKKLDICFIALNKGGEFGAAGTIDFPHAITRKDQSEILTAQALT
jgi:N4-(beta-N-acetylglucosaminyl)-L-asparaginase